MLGVSEVRIARALEREVLGGPSDFLDSPPRLQEYDYDSSTYGVDVDETGRPVATNLHQRRAQEYEHDRREASNDPKVIRARRQAFWIWALIGVAFWSMVIVKTIAAAQQ